MIVDLLEYRVVPGHDAELAGYLRHEGLRTPAAEGLIARFVGRRLSREGRENLAASLWRDEPAFANGTDTEAVPSYLAAVSELLGDRVSRQYRVVAPTGIDRGGAKVLRLYRTTMPTEMVVEWERQAFRLIGQLAMMEGLLAGVAAVEAGPIDEGQPEPEVRVVVLTTWTEWGALLAATGGRLNRSLTDIEPADLERPASADHFELVDADPRSA